MNLELMLRDGYTQKYAEYYLRTLQKEESMACFNTDYVRWAHNHGFFAESAYCYGLNESNYKKYLSDYDFYKAWPLDNWTRIWINDKLTLKYLLANTEYNHFMPKYYYYTSPNGLRSLIDCEGRRSSTQDFINTLKEVGVYACKPCNGSTSVGFFKISYNQGVFVAQGKTLLESEIDQFLHEYPNYLFTEYLVPSDSFLRYGKQIHTLRLVTINKSGNDPIIVGGYFRLPCNNNCDANYVVLGEDEFEQFNLFVDIDVETGHYFNAKKTYINRIENVLLHPETNEKLDGYIDDFITLKETVLGIAKRFCTLEYLGFDIGITNNGFKCMEINSLPGCKYMQIFKPFGDNPIINNFFRDKILNINQLSRNQKLSRNKIVR